ncbi:MAG: hypothetical protein B7Y23_10235 [Sulfurovum sp. 16-42-52]|nr:MAG: hypothetical protein B7Y23_10235 [Sulfurovum sp. 16-42-52]
MTGKILGFDTTSNTGTISGDDGKRYNFSKESWKEKHAPQKDAKVDFDMDDNSKAIDIYQIKDVAAANNDMVMGLLSLGITFFFGFIGTFVSRLILSKQPIEQTIMPTLIHFIATIAVLVPVLGWFIYLIATVYYMVQNYKLVISEPALENKYA